MRALLSLFLALITFALQAQQRCGTVEYEKIRSLRPKKETPEQFEQWMQLKLAQPSKPFRDKRAQTTLIVPVVVHIIHNGEAVGTGTNIPDAQILSQIDVINKDFQRMNADASQTQAEFAGVAGSMDIQFVLAKQDPDGLATNGIVRLKGSQAAWSMNEDLTLKSLSYWPAESYLNLWIVNLSGDFLGYTQLPVSNTLPGLDQSSNDRLTDGIVIDYMTFGTKDAGSFNLESRFDKGRTATHEIGHYFGLRHIWGDSFCGTDYVDDTPTQSTSTSGCPSGVMTSCSSHNMYQNYLDYTDDACMNLFTNGQVTRMNVVAQNSPRRATLANSLGALPPAPVADDLGIKSVVNPVSTSCSGNIIPSLLIRNYGTTTITSAKIQFFLNGSTIGTTSFPLSLAASTETTVNFAAVSLSEGNSYAFDFKITQVNGGADGNAANDELIVNTVTPVSAAIPVLETFNSTPTNWNIENPSGVNPWENISVSATNKAMYLNFYNNENIDTYSRLVTPVLDLTNATTANLTFDYAYSPYPGVTIERLRVLVYTDCAYDGTSVEVFNKAGNALATTAEVGSSFVPTDSDWQANFISLSAFLGQKIQIAFEGTNGYGNNLYLDNVTVTNAPVSAFSIADLVSPSPISCQNEVAPVIAVKNLGNTIITSMEAHVYVNGGTGIYQTISGISIDPNTSQNISLNSIQLTTGNNQITIAIRKPNGGNNAGVGDSLVFVRNINSAADKIPLRQNFDKSSIGSWAVISPQSGQNWFLAQTNKNISLLFNAFSNTLIGEQAWLVSPVIDFSSTAKASLFFDTSYGKRSASSEKLDVYASEDCGESFPTLIYSASGSNLATAQSETSWLPTGSSDWYQNYVNLDTYVGKKNVRFAFVATNGNGNNLYLDNIEFFEDDKSYQIPVNSPYGVYGGLTSPVQITFHLDERQDTRVQVYNDQGKLMSDQVLAEVFNQTYTIDVPNAAAGIYIVRVQIGGQVSATKVWIGF